MALANHRTWLLGQAEKLFPFFERRLINPLGGFYELDEEGRPTAPGYDAADKPAGTFSQPQGSFALTPPLISWVGQARTSSLITELVFLWSGHRDSDYAGYYWGVGYDGPLDPIKQAYGHAFVLLAASSAKGRRAPGCRSTSY